MKKALYILLLLVLVVSCSSTQKFTNKYEKEAWEFCAGPMAKYPHGGYKQYDLYTCEKESRIRSYCASNQRGLLIDVFKMKPIDQDKFSICIHEETKKCKLLNEETKRCISSLAEYLEKDMQKRLQQCRDEGGCK